MKGHSDSQQWSELNHAATPASDRILSWEFCRDVTEERQQGSLRRGEREFITSGGGVGMFRISYTGPSGKRCATHDRAYRIDAWMVRT